MRRTRFHRPVDVEVLLLSVDDGRLEWEVRRAPLGEGAPDQGALDLADSAAGQVSHSTSWRDDDGVLVLTYAVVGAPRKGHANSLHVPSVICSSDPSRPSPPVLHLHHVVAHAVRHVSDLLHRDPVVAAALQSRPELVQALHGAAATMPVAPHTQAHELARAQTGWAAARP